MRVQLHNDISKSDQKRLGKEQRTFISSRIWGRTSLQLAIIQAYFGANRSAIQGRLVWNAPVSHPFDPIWSNLYGMIGAIRCQPRHTPWTSIKIIKILLSIILWRSSIWCFLCQCHGDDFWSWLWDSPTNFWFLFMTKIIAMTLT